jgi:ubiquinone/menaquinone biosynthesis C-methylase UbiE
MKEFYRILKPGGHLLLWEPSAGSILNLLRKIWYKLDKKYFI